jgi:CRP-like cAMP-binding protein
MLATEREAEFPPAHFAWSDPMPGSNSLLDSLSSGDTAALRPHLKSVRLEQKQILFAVGDVVSTVYFPTSSVVSLVVGLSTGEFIEAAMVGRDGVIGASSALDGRIAITRAIVQLPGNALICSTDALASVAFQSRTLLTTLVSHEQTVYAQAQQSTACMASHDVQSRFCRWLLRARDLAGTDTLPFTQEFLADMLGVRRTSVSPVANALQQAGMISYSRGKIEIRNVEGIQETACECYEAIKSNYSRLLKQP